MNKWLEALWFDATKQESKNRLDKKERLVYDIVMSATFFTVCVLNMFTQYPYNWIVSVGCFFVGARKLQIWLHKKKQMEEQSK